MNIVGSLGNLNEQTERERERQTLDIAELESIIDRQQHVIDTLELAGADATNGFIVRVDDGSMIVWINLGAADLLKPRDTLDVYGNESLEANQRAKDLKGKIEITRVLGPHVAEARITESDLLRPLVKNDRVYSSARNPRKAEKISIIGLIDLDMDGQSDREELVELMTLSGAQVDNEVDAEGNRIPADGRITSQTTYLVVGNIPKPDDAMSEDDKAKVIRIRKHLSDMLDEARTSGVRVIRMNAFLAYGGEGRFGKSKGRAGQSESLRERPFNLGTNPVPGAKLNSGETSKRLFPKKSNP